MIVPIEGYAPDIDPTTPGILTNCASLVPSLKGFEGAPAPLDIDIDALAAACQGGDVLRKLDDTLRLFAATGTALYELSGTSWTDRTRAVGGAYGLGTDLRWSFAQFGDVSLAVCKTDTMQSSTTAAFADISGAPKATIVETVGQFVFAMDYDDGSDVPHGWYCCAKGDYTDWTPSIANECATGVLTSSPGPIKAGKRFGDAIIAYKLRSMYLGVYVGVPAIWDFREIPGEAGALGQYAVVDIGTPEEPKHIFMGYDDFYQFDGSRPVPIGSPVKETVFGEINRSYAHRSIAMHDQANSRVYFFYCSSANLTPDKCVVYNYRTGKWGRDDRTIEFAMQYAGSGITYDSLGTYYSTYDSLPNLSYDSSFFTAATLIPAVFDSSHILKTLNAPNVSSSMTTGDYGDDQLFTTLSRVRPRFITKPSAATMTNYYRNNLGDSLTTDAMTAMDSNARFDLMREARWHRVRIEFTGPVELPALSADFIQGGAE
jgi:hypothetical protein